MPVTLEGLQVTAWVAWHAARLVSVALVVALRNGDAGAWVLATGLAVSTTIMAFLFVRAARGRSGASGAG